jgi:hypothetical protein
VAVVAVVTQAQHPEQVGQAVAEQVVMMLVAALLVRLTQVAVAAVMVLLAALVLSLLRILVCNVALAEP